MKKLHALVRYTRHVVKKGVVDGVVDDIVDVHVIDVEVDVLRSKEM